MKKTIMFSILNLGGYRFMDKTGITQNDAYFQLVQHEPKHQLVQTKWTYGQLYSYENYIYILCLGYSNNILMIRILK